ncbi:lycopene cyclase domain-containing protein [Cryobacterium tepidiphilum]|uniref:Lycopene cyclase domain-containing protein n=1 Tax=Cryobacterium tepidiphilum TaxID=2486026 RepID=A0A3M8LRB5_9MICO|nr:lycopene cyclase domain-containing protein [Cryobacterium tepidiphilum]RNE67284.1 lycopene cyclase domain-containing protein [Cryobacterium tepidiphilum]
MTYIGLSLAFLALAALVLTIALAAHPAGRALATRWWLPVALAGLVVLALTAVFDNVMIRLGLMTYAPDAISGVLVGVAPLEDFAYPLAALLLLPALWLLFGRRGDHDR